MAVLEHARNQTTSCLARISGLHAIDVRVEEQLVRGTEKNLPLAVHAGDVADQSPDHHGKNGRLQCLLGQLRKIGRC